MVFCAAGTGSLCFGCFDCLRCCAAQTTTISGTFTIRGWRPVSLIHFSAQRAGVRVDECVARRPRAYSALRREPDAHGRQCGPGAFTNTAVDGSFTLQDIPENATYTIVIQAGKWQRQFTETVGTSPLTGLQLSMPANHTQGNMPYIATLPVPWMGECVLRDMGISDSEFTDDKQTVNAGGYVHLYRGSSSPGRTSMRQLPRKPC